MMLLASNFRKGSGHLVQRVDGERALLLRRWSWRRSTPAPASAGPPSRPGGGGSRSSPMLSSGRRARPVAASTASRRRNAASTGPRGGPSARRSARRRRRAEDHPEHQREQQRQRGDDRRPRRPGCRRCPASGGPAETATTARSRSPAAIPAVGSEVDQPTPGYQTSTQACASETSIRRSPFASGVPYARPVASRAGMPGPAAGRPRRRRTARRSPACEVNRKSSTASAPGAGSGESSW